MEEGHDRGPQTHLGICARVQRDDAVDIPSQERVIWDVQFSWDIDIVRLGAFLAVLDTDSVITSSILTRYMSVSNTGEWPHRTADTP